MAGKEGTEPDTRSLREKILSTMPGKLLGKAYEIMGPVTSTVATDIRQKVVEEGVYGRVTTPQPVTIPSGIHGKMEKTEAGGSVWGDKEPTEKQLSYLQGQGVDTEGMTRGQASEAITSLGKPQPEGGVHGKTEAKAEPGSVWGDKEPTEKQVSYLQGKGIDTEGMTRGEASAAITALVKGEPATKAPSSVPVDHDTVHSKAPGWADKEPTEKQLSILEAKGIDTEGLTRGEASKAIENLGYDASWYEGPSFRERCLDTANDHAPAGRSIDTPQPSAPDR